MTELHTTTLMLKRMRLMKSVLEACEEYFEARADAEYFTDSASPCANEEMNLLVEIQQALAIAMAPKAETEGLRGLSPAKRGAKQSPKAQS